MCRLHLASSFKVQILGCILIFALLPHHVDGLAERTLHEWPAISLDPRLVYDSRPIIVDDPLLCVLNPLLRHNFDGLVIGSTFFDDLVFLLLDCDAVLDIDLELVLPCLAFLVVFLRRDLTNRLVFLLGFYFSAFKVAQSARLR
jgi:hypothetical protein